MTWLRYSLLCAAQVMSWKEWRAEQCMADAKVQALTGDVQTLQARVDALQAVTIPSRRRPVVTCLNLQSSSSTSSPGRYETSCMHARISLVALCML